VNERGGAGASGRAAQWRKATESDGGRNGEGRGAGADLGGGVFDEGVGAEGLAGDRDE
jgi:hypothetical protein